MRWVPAKPASPWAHSLCPRTQQSCFAPMDSTPPSNMGAALGHPDFVQGLDSLWSEYSGRNRYDATALIIRRAQSA